MSETLIKVEGLYKKFTRDLKRSLMYGTADTFRSMVGINYKTDHLRKSEFWAVKDINFELKRGQFLGLIGRNGSGKSTLLRVLTGIFPPDQGKISMKGRVGALIAVGAGFHPHMTGKENVYLNGTILGMPRSEVKKKYDDIVEFSEIGEFINAPVATYSSGMRVRLGFAIAVHISPDILLIDEILAVGDVGFRAKCFKKINELQKDAAVILVSHSMNQVSRVCTDILLMDKGESVFYGKNISEGIQKYYQHFKKEEYRKIGNADDIDILSFLLNEQSYNGDIKHIFEVFSNIRVHLKVKTKDKYKNLAFQISIFDQELKGVALMSTENANIKYTRNDSDEFIIETKIPCNFSPGKYTLNLHFFHIENGRYNGIGSFMHIVNFTIKGSDLHTYIPVHFDVNWEGTKVGI